jgi:hypothetical protein
MGEERSGSDPGHFLPDYGAQQADIARHDITEESTEEISHVTNRVTSAHCAYD